MITINIVNRTNERDFFYYSFSFFRLNTLCRNMHIPQGCGVNFIVYIHIKENTEFLKRCFHEEESDDIWGREGRFAQCCRGPDLFDKFSTHLQKFRKMS